MPGSKGWPHVKLHRSVLHRGATRSGCTAHDTYVPTRAYLLYLTILLDAGSPLVVGWAMAPSLTTRVMLSELNTAIGQRQLVAVIHRSGHDCPPTWLQSGHRCREVSVQRLRGSVGDANLKAIPQRFSATIACELLHRRRLDSRAEAKLEGKGLMRPRNRGNSNSIEWWLAESGGMQCVMDFNRIAVRLRAAALRQTA
jgi:transposase InsO family protein